MNHRRCDERFHPHHSSTHHPHTHQLDPDERLAQAPHEFVHPVSFLHAVYTLPQNILIGLLRLTVKSYPHSMGMCADIIRPAPPTGWKRSPLMELSAVSA